MHFAERLLLPGPRSVDLVSKGFDRVRNPRKEAAEGEEEAPPSPDPPQEAPVQRSESARGWGPRGGGGADEAHGLPKGGVRQRRRGRRE